jgi:hypothetical protein
LLSADTRIRQINSRLTVAEEIADNRKRCAGISEPSRRFLLGIGYIWHGCHGNQDTAGTTSLHAHHAHRDYGLLRHDRSMPRPVSPWRYLVVTALLRHPALRLSPVTYR